MEFALAPLAISPAELETLGWSFADRKRLIDWLLTASEAAQGIDPAVVGKSPIELALPHRDVDRLLTFARRELPREASRADVVDWVLDALRVGLTTEESISK